MFDYPVTLTPDGDTVLVTFADVPEALTFGVDEEEALLHAVDALETALSFYVEARKPLPVASKPRRGQRTVRPSALEGAKLGVYQAMTEQGIKKAELARRLGRGCDPRQLEISYKEDPGILGGFVARIGEQVHDYSVSGRLARLRRRLAEA